MSNLLIYKKIYRNNLELYTMCSKQVHNVYRFMYHYICKLRINLIMPPLPEGGGGYTVLPLSVLPSVQDIFHRIFLSNC